MLRIDDPKRECVERRVKRRVVCPTPTNTEPVTHRTALCANHQPVERTLHSHSLSIQLGSGVELSNPSRELCYITALSGQLLLALLGRQLALMFSCG